MSAAIFSMEYFVEVEYKKNIGDCGPFDKDLQLFTMSILHICLLPAYK